MLILLDDLVERYKMRINGVLHVGAHLGEEAPVYHRLKVGKVTWIEGNPSLIKKLGRNVHPYGHDVIHCLVADRNYNAEFHITNNGESSSLLELGTHLETSPQVYVKQSITLPTIPIDDLDLPHSFNFLNLDLQGAELLALKGMPRELMRVEYIYSEVNKRPVYKDCVQVEELDEFLFAFDRVETLWCTDRGVDHGWGDALYVRKGLLP